MHIQVKRDADDLRTRLHAAESNLKHVSVFVTTEIPTIIDPSPTVNYPGATGSIIVVSYMLSMNILNGHSYS